MTQRLNYIPLASYAVKSFMTIEKAVAERVDSALLHLLKARASQINGCEYCLHMHTTDALGEGESVERLMLLPMHEVSNHFNERERAALAYTEIVTRVSEQGVPDAVFARLRASYTEQEIVDLTIAVAMINLWNRIAIAMANEPPTTVHRAQRER